MSNIYDNQIKEMQRLINYGKKTSPSQSQSIVEFHAKGADGKTYGIIRECNKFYIKVAPPKDTEVLAEDYDYIGGFNNKKENEYSTYTLASKQFDLKMKSLNEAYNNKVYTSQYKPSESAEWQITETKEMRKELDRYKQLVENVNKIAEGKEIIGMAHDVPEAPAKNPSDKKVNAPFTDVAVAPEDKDLKYAENSYVNTGSPYNAGGKLTNSDVQTDKKNSSDKNPKMDGNDGDTYTEKPEFGPKFDKDNAVAGKKAEGGKAVKMNESRKGRTIKINEEQVLAWSKSKDFMDKSHGTEIGSSAPFGDEVEGCANGTYCEADTEPIREDVAVHNTDNQNSPEPGVSEPGHNGDPFEEKINEEVVDTDDVEGFDDEEVKDVDVDNIGFEGENNNVDDSAFYNDEGLKGLNLDDYEIVSDEEEESDKPAFTGDDLEDFLRYGSETPRRDDQESGLDDYDREIDFDPYEMDFYESRKRRGRRVNEVKLNDFGKHPAYRKEVMTLPPNKEIDRYGKDWNDDSAKGEEPFGKKIGSSAPYTDKVIEMITDAIVNKLTKKKV